MHRGVLVMLLVIGGCTMRPLGLEGEPPIVGASDLSLAVAPDLSVPNQAPDLGSGNAPDMGNGNEGSGLFVSTLSNLPLPNGYHPLSVVVADVTGDGRKDVVVGANSDPNYLMAVIVFAQTPNGSLAAPVVYPAGNGGAQTPSMLAVADLNDDGRLDVALTGYTDVRILMQTSAGTLGPPRKLAPTRTDDAELVATGDFDGDGLADVLGAAWNVSGVDVWRQSEALATPHNFDCPHGGLDAMAVADFDGDGTLDVAISSFNASSVCLLLQRPGGFAPAVTLPLMENPPPEAVAAGDVDGDGRPDLLLVSGLRHAGQYLDILHQDKNGTFILSNSLKTDYWPNGILLADVDGDGRLDAVVPHYDMLVVGIYRQLPGGGLAAEETYPYARSEISGDGPQRTAVGDINGDGKPDIVSVATNVNVLYHR
jgi:hypothetical protein